MSYNFSDCRDSWSWINGNRNISCWWITVGWNIMKIKSISSCCARCEIKPYTLIVSITSKCPNLRLSNFTWCILCCVSSKIIWWRSKGNRISKIIIYWASYKVPSKIKASNIFIRLRGVCYALCFQIICIASIKLNLKCRVWPTCNINCVINKSTVWHLVRSCRFS